MGLLATWTLQTIGGGGGEMVGLTSSRNLKQVVTYWAPTDTNEFGETVLADPILLNARWTEQTDLVRNQHGDQVFTHAMIHTDQQCNEEGWLALGDLTNESDPTNLGLDKKVCSEIRAIRQYPDLRYLETANIAYI